MYLLLRVDQRLKQNHEDVLLPARLQELYLSWKKCTDVEPEDDSPVAYPVLKQMSTLLRHGHLPREDGAIEFWRKTTFGTVLCDLNIGLMKCGRLKWQKAEETRKNSILY